MSVVTDQHGHLSITGDLTFDSVPAVYEQAQSVLTADSGNIDLMGVQAIDSAGLALLLEWQAGSKASGSSLTFSNAPSDLRRLAALSDATELLGLSARQETHPDS